MEQNVQTSGLNRIALPGFIFPSISYFLLMAQNPCLIDTGAHFVKQSPRNHYEILSANGRLKLTLPIERSHGQSMPTHHMRIEQGNWYKNQLTAIQSAYGKSAFFFYFKEEIQALMTEIPGLTLGEAQQRSLRFIFKNTFTPSYEAKEIYVTDETFLQDFRMAKNVPFRKGAINKYHQVFQDRFDFQDNLSILDLLFNMGPEAKHYLHSHPKLKLVPADHQSSSA